MSGETRCKGSGWLIVGLEKVNQRCRGCLDCAPVGEVYNTVLSALHSGEPQEAVDDAICAAYMAYEEEQGK